MKRLVGKIFSWTLFQFREIGQARVESQWKLANTLSQTKPGLIPKPKSTRKQIDAVLECLKPITPDSGQMRLHFGSTSYCDRCAFFGLELVITGSQSKHN